MDLEDFKATISIAVSWCSKPFHGATVQDGRLLMNRVGQNRIYAP